MTVNAIWFITMPVAWTITLTFTLAFTLDKIKRSQ